MTEVDPPAAVTGEVSVPAAPTFSVAPLATVVLAAVSVPLSASVPALTPSVPDKTEPVPVSVRVPVPTLFTLALLAPRNPPVPNVPEKVVELLFAPTFIVPLATTRPVPDKPPRVVVRPKFSRMPLTMNVDPGLNDAFVTAMRSLPVFTVVVPV